MSPQVIQDPTVGSVLQRLFRLTGRVRPSLEEYVIPTVKVADLSLTATPPVSPHAVANFGQTAVVGERTTWRLEVPPGQIAQINRIIVRPSAATNGNLTVFFGSSITAPANTAVSKLSDERLRLGSSVPAGVLSYGTQVGGLAVIDWRYWVLGQTPNVIEPPRGWVIGGSPSAFGFIEFSLAVDNLGADVTLEWDEYSLI